MLAPTICRMKHTHMPRTIQGRMARALQKSLMVSAIVGAMMTIMKVAGVTVAPIYIFGDSSMDVGTNNNLKECTARADHPYYGVDLHSKPTGRFSNGYNTADAIVQLLGGYESSPPPFLTIVKRNETFKQNLLRGVNFASGGGGLFRETDQAYYGRVISFEEQIQQFATVAKNITALLGTSKGDLLLQESMYIISIGSNDIVNYIFNRTMTPKQLIANLTDAYATHLQNLHSLGARKFGIISVAALGCAPIARSIAFAGDCVDEPNEFAVAFYTSVQSLLKNLSSTLEGFKYSLGNAYNMSMNIINNPVVTIDSIAGFKDVKTACCGNTTKHPFILCEFGSPLCKYRDDYLFWDAVHPSQAGSEFAARILVYGDRSDFVTPINFSTLRRA
ncbi:hypothetical protein L1887_35728 [Cichorium endivia]|nr:hypothetical protein L1887_35728 [Cichorium endivia]